MKKNPPQAHQPGLLFGSDDSDAATEPVQVQTADEAGVTINPHEPASVSTEQPKTLIKDVEYILMIPLPAGNPTAAKMNLVDRKVYDGLLWLARNQFSSGSGPEDSIGPGGLLFSSPISALIDLLNMRRIYSTKKMVHIISGLQAVTVRWVSLKSSGDTEELRIFNLFSEIRFFEKDGLPWVSWAYPPTVGERLMEPEIFAKIDFSMMNRMSTYASRVLYELCSRYKTSPHRRTAGNSVEWWVEVLSTAPVGYQKEVPLDVAESSKNELVRYLAGAARMLGQNMVRIPKRQMLPWTQFKRHYLLPAIEIINETSDLFIKLREEKDGRRIVGAYFEVEPKTVVLDAESQKIRTGLIEQMKALGISESQAERFIGEFSVVTLGQAIGRLSSRATQGGDVRSSAAYLRVVARDIDGGQSDDMFDGESSEPASAADSPPAVAEEEKMVVLANKTLDAEMVPTHSTSQVHQQDDPESSDLTSNAIKEILSLPDEVQTRLFEDVIRSLPTAIQQAPMTRRAIKQGPLGSPFMKPRVVKQYLENKGRYS